MIENDDEGEGVEVERRMVEDGDEVVEIDDGPQDEPADDE